MRPIAADIAHCFYVSVRVCVLGTTVICAKMAESVEMSFGCILFWVPGTRHLMKSRSTTGMNSFEGACASQLESRDHSFLNNGLTSPKI